MKGQNKDIADSKGFGVWMLQVIIKSIVTVPGFILSAYQAVKGKYFGGYMYTLGYGGDIWGNKLIAPHANAKWVKPEGHQYGGDEPISLPLALSVRDNTILKPAIKYVISIEKADKNHMRKTLRAHGYELKNIDLNIEEIMNKSKEKINFMDKYKLFIMLSFYLGIGIPLNYHTFPHPICVVYDIVLPIFIYLVNKKNN